MLGSLEAARDWGYTPDFADAAVRIVRHERADDFVIATGEVHTVKELVEHAFALVGLDWKTHVRVDPALVRPAESLVLVGNAKKAEKELGWRPAVRFNELTRVLLRHELALKNLQLPEHV